MAKARRDPESFDLPVEKIRAGYYSDKYFVRTREILDAQTQHPHVLMQVFARRAGVLCGVDEAIAIIKRCSVGWAPKIQALRDGDRIGKMEVVMTIEGGFPSFAHLETVYLGVLARSTSIATNVAEVVEAADGKSVLFFPARFDHYAVQESDGYAALIAGVSGVSTDANGAWMDVVGLGTIPHALIAAYSGSTVDACQAFHDVIDGSVKRIALVDFENDSVRTSLEVAYRLRGDLWGVRLDTSGSMVDVSVDAYNEESFGVCPELVWKVRKALDDAGFGHVKIIVSGGFNAEKVRLFNKLGVPYDGIGVGSTFFRDRTDFTADIVMVDYTPCAKVGRGIWDHSRLSLVE